MTPRALLVFICGSQVGTIVQDERGLLSFRYDDGYRGIPLSLAMPVSNRVYRQKVLLPFLFGLLPDDEAQRRSIARTFGVRASNPFELLSCMGLDCPGGVQLCTPEQRARVAGRAATYQPLTDHEIAERLAAIRRDQDATWIGAKERWSLGGQQGKFALAWHEGTWCSCEGSAPTTHIFKNGVRGFRLQALNEFICMKTAAACGIPCADVSYRFFDDEPALIITRYDRFTDQDGCVHRAHQEDFCQVLGKFPSEKYAGEGGPGVRDLFRILAKTDAALLNAQLLTAMMLYNYLIGGTDAHAKNFSLLLGVGTNAALAPLYDVASGLAYESLRQGGKLAMSIGGENRFGRVGAGAVTRFARAAQDAGIDLDEHYCLSFMRELAERVPHALRDALDAHADLPGADELRAHLLDAVAKNCQRTLTLL